MKILWLATASVLAQFAPLATAADTKPLDIKAGLWETTTTVATEGMPALPAWPAMPQIPKETLDKMPAEQRVSVELLLKGPAGAGSPSTFVSKSCETTESRAAGSSYALQTLTKKLGCKDIVSSTPSKMQAHVECTNSSVGLHSVSDIVQERIDSEHINGTEVSQTDLQGKSWTLKSSSMSRWVSSDCGEVRPFIIK
jgi:hypothetical protein